MNQKTYEPQASIKLNKHCELLILNCNLPKCPQNLIDLVVDEKQITISTPKFSKHYEIKLAVPAECSIIEESMEQKMNGELFTATWKVKLSASDKIENEKTTIPLVVHPKIMKAHTAKKFVEKNDKVPLLSNVVDKRNKDEKQVIEKIANAAIDKVVNQEKHKEEELQKQEQAFEEQVAARKAMKEEKRSKKRGEKTETKTGK